MMIRKRWSVSVAASAIVAAVLFFAIRAAAAQPQQEGQPHVNATNPNAESDGGGQGQDGEPHASVFRMRPSSSNLIDHGGKILPSSTIYAIYWGNQSAFPIDLKSGMTTFLEGLNGSRYLGISDQYMRGAALATSLNTVNLVDSSSPPARAPAVSTIVNEACKMIGQAGLTANTDGMYFVFTSNFPGGHVNFCSWHSFGTCNGATIQVIYGPNTSGISGCDPGDLYNANTYTEGTRSMVNVAAHEASEVVTDPTASAWYDSSGAEIGDKCAWQFSGPVTLANGSVWQLQEEWSNSASGCVQGQ